MVFVLSKSVCSWLGLYALLVTLGKGEQSEHQIPKEFTSHQNWHLLDRGDDCGMYSAERIIGGKDATLGQFPWMALLGYLSTSNESMKGEVAISYDEVALGPNQSKFIVKFLCGGTIINDRYVLTAAHCSTKGNKHKLLMVRLGENILHQETDCEDDFCADPVQDILVQQEICHPEYEKYIYHNDICLLRLAKQMVFNDFVQPICLPVYDFQIDQRYEGKVMHVAGWGVTNVTTITTSKILQWVGVSVISQKVCMQMYSWTTDISYSQVCAGGVVGKDSCFGDSGGPLMSLFSVNTYSRYFVVGVVSFGLEFCGSSMPGIYTSVSQFIPWILDSVNE